MDHMPWTCRRPRNVVEVTHLPITPAAVPRSPATPAEAMQVETHKCTPQLRLLEIEASAVITKLLNC